MILHYAQRVQSKKAAAKRFDIKLKQIRDWEKKREQLMSSAPYIKKLHPERSPSLPELEKPLFQWLQNLRQESKAIIHNMVVKKAKKMAEADEMKQLYPTIQDFKFSNKWLDSFIGKYNLSNRRRTTISQQLPEDLIEKQHSFLSFILYRRIQYDYPLNLIANLDKTSLSFDLPSSTTLELKGSKTVSIRSTGHEKNCFTVVLACMVDGTKLEPVIIFKLKNIPREVFSDRVKIQVNEKGWVNEKEML